LFFFAKEEGDTGAVVRFGVPRVENLSFKCGNLTSEMKREEVKKEVG